jgi:hypothetical protein
MTDNATSGPADAPQFIVYAGATLLQQVLNDLAADPEVKVLKLGGPATAPDRIVAQMAEARAEALRQTFGDQVVVEPDEPLTAFSQE